MQSVLPFIEQGSLQNSFQGDSAWLWDNNHTIVPSLQCPSNPSAPKNMTAGAATPEASQGAHGNYVMCAGSTIYGNSGQGQNLNGTFYPLSKTRFADIIDGTSNTLLASEIITVPDTSSHDLRGRYYNTWQGNVLFSTFQSPNTSVGDVSSYCISMPYAPCAALSSSNVVQYARSMHPGGVQCTLSDGSVRFIAETVNLTTWRNLAQRNDGIPLGEF